MNTGMTLPPIKDRVQTDIIGDVKLIIIRGLITMLERKFSLHSQCSIFPSRYIILNLFDCYYSCILFRRSLSPVSSYLHQYKVKFRRKNDRGPSKTTHKARATASQTGSKVLSQPLYVTRLALCRRKKKSQRNNRQLRESQKPNSRNSPRAALQLGVNEHARTACRGGKNKSTSQSLGKKAPKERTGGAGCSRRRGGRES